MTAKPQEQRLAARQAKAAAALAIVTRVGSADGDTATEAPETTSSLRLTTPKMKWMMRWSQQLLQEKDTTGASTAGDTETTNAEDAQVQSSPQENAAAEAKHDEKNAAPSHVADAAATATTAPPQVVMPATTGAVEDRDTVVEDGEVGEVVEHVESTERTGESRRGAPEQTNELRVTMPPAVESSSLSPSMERGSPTAASTSISPSAKVKEVDGSVVVRSRTPSPAMMMLDETTAEPVPEVSAKTSVKPKLPSSSQSPAGETRERQNDPEPLERLPSKRKSQETSAAGEETKTPMAESTAHLSESERQRLERRKRRKSNWDVGDPRKHGGSIDLAALNLLSSTSTPATHPASFAKFPRQRPAYRHSQSLDTKEHPPFQRRASFGSGLSYSSPPTGSVPLATAPSFAQSPPATSSLPPVAPSVPRRAFNHSNSMPPPSSRPGSSRFSTHGGYR